MNHELHENDKQPPRSIAAEWHQVAVERAKRIRELERILRDGVEGEDWDSEMWGHWQSDAESILEKRRIVKGGEVYHPTI